MSDIFSTILFSVEARSAKPKCLGCGEIVEMTEKREMSICSCGGIVLNPRRMAYQSSVNVQPKCIYCDDSGLIFVPVSGDVFYTAVARCRCPAGDSVSPKIASVPESIIELSGRFGEETFMGRRRAIHDAIERMNSEVKNE